MGVLTAHHLQPPPVALLSVTGITTYRHPFFNSSTLLTPKPIEDAEVAHLLSDPTTVVGVAAEGGDRTVFSVDMLLPSGNKNLDYVMPPRPTNQVTEPADSEISREMLYDYYLYKNDFVRLVGDVDPGFEWASTEAGKDKLKSWPPTIIIQGNDDFDVDLKVSTHMVDCLGEDTVKIFIAEGQGHRFEQTKFLEDDDPGMDSVRNAVECLDKVIAAIP